MNEMSKEIKKIKKELLALRNSPVVDKTFDTMNQASACCSAIVDSTRICNEVSQRLSSDDFSPIVVKGDCGAILYIHLRDMLAIMRSKIKFLESFLSPESIKGFNNIADKLEKLVQEANRL